MLVAKGASEWRFSATPVYRPRLDALKAAGATTIYREKISGTRADRPQLAKLMAALKPGDVVVGRYGTTRASAEAERPRQDGDSSVPLRNLLDRIVDRGRP
jgi:hypothetical protein